MIGTSDISATTLKLTALASIMERLMRKNRPGYLWSRDARSLSAQLVKGSSAGFLDDLLLVCSVSSPLLWHVPSVDHLASLFRAGRRRGRAKDLGENSQQDRLS